jgi:uncharacterized protein (TIRG00374 family)
VTIGRLVRFFLPFAISAALVLLLARFVAGEWDELVGALAAADWRLLVPAIGLYFVGTWLRSLRWGLLLPAHAVGTATLFRALVIGFTVNNLLPLRMGEVARAYLLARWGRVPYGATIASLVMERVLDGLALAVLLLVALLLVPAPGYLLVVGALAAAGFLGGALMLALASWRASLIVRLAELVARPLPSRLGILLLRLATSFAHTLTLVRGAGRLVRLLGLSLAAWCFELGLFFVMLRGFGLPGSYPLALLVGSAANFATLVPSSPGYVGTFDSVLVKVLNDTAGVPAGLATAYAFGVHAALFFPVVVLGTLLLWRSHLTFDQIVHAPEGVPTSPAGGDWPAAA